MSEIRIDSIRRGFAAAHRSWAVLFFYLGIWSAAVAAGYVISVRLVPSVPIEHHLTVWNGLSPSIVRTDQLLFWPPSIINATDALAQILLRRAALIQRPVSIAYLAVLMSVCLWLYSGQIGALAAALRGEKPSLAIFREAANRSVVGVGMAMGTTGLAWLLARHFLQAWLGRLSPAGASAIFFLEATGGIALMLWLIIIVTERAGPAGALRRTVAFFSRQGRGYLALCLMLGFVSLALRVGFANLEALDALRPVPLRLGGMAAHAILYFYLQFVFTAELIDFYQRRRGA